MGKTVHAYLTDKKIITDIAAMTKALVGRTVKIKSLSTGHNYGSVGSKFKIECFIGWNGSNVILKNNQGAYIGLNEIEILPQTIEELQNEKLENDKLIADLIEEKNIIDNKIAFLQENNLEEYDEELFKITEVLKKLDDGSLTGIERAKAIADIIKGY